MNTLVLRRRLIYISIMVALLIPLYFLGHPSVRDKDGSAIQEGGSLAAIRTNYDLNHSDVGELDPASESARLATLGLRGVAATILWQRAEHYKREKYFDRLSATVNQLRILQPHYVKVWEFQAHNLAWNVSVEFDDYRQRYEWVKKGIDFLIDGSKYNKKRTEMPFELGWAFGNKMGMSDERVQFRELFRNDRNFHNEIENRCNLSFLQPSALGPDSKPDNWRCGALWYQRSYDMVDAGSNPARSPLMFYVKAPQWQYKHADAIQLEGYLGEEARTAWRLAGTQWNTYGQRLIKTSYGTTIFLTEMDIAQARLQELENEFHQFCGEGYTKALQARRDQLTPEQIAALDKSQESLSPVELRLAESARLMLKIPVSELLLDIPEEKKVKALEMAGQLNLLATRIDHIGRYRDQVNYPYWEARCVAEQDDAALAARTNIYEAAKLMDLGKLKEALDSYDQAWVQWANLFNHYPAVMIDDTALEVEKAITYYLQIRDIPNPPVDFPLNKFLKFRQLYESGNWNDKPVVTSLISQWPKRFPGRNFLEDVLLDDEKVDQSSAPTDSFGDAQTDVPKVEADQPDTQSTVPPDQADLPAEQTSTEPSESKPTTPAGDLPEVEQPDSSGPDVPMPIPPEPELPVEPAPAEVPGPVDPPLEPTVEPSIEPTVEPNLGPPAEPPAEPNVEPAPVEPAVEPVIAD